MVDEFNGRPLRVGIVVYLSGAVFYSENATIVSIDRVIPLTRSECRMLQLLLLAEDGTVSRAQIVDAMSYKVLVSQSRAVDMIVSMVRAKLRDADVDAKIVAIRNYGYRFEGYRSVVVKCDEQRRAIAS